jgi:fructoselysine transporter
MSKEKISLYLAILININIVIGGGFFLSIQAISPRTGVLAPLIWLSVALLLLPLTIVLAKLSRTEAVSGGLYVYSRKKLGEFWGFLSGWGYLIGTAAGNAVILHGFRKLSEELGLTNYLFNSFGISGIGADIFFIIFFTLLNLFNIKILGKTQGLITILKTIPFAIVILGGLCLFKVTNFTLAPPTNISNFMSTIPIALFAYIGIEACCAISHIIKDGKKNTAKVILISFMIIAGIYSLIQFLLIGIHGTHFINPFTSIIPKLTNNPSVIKYGNIIIQSAILSSFLGGYYSMFYANNWNIFAIAKENKLPFSKSLTKLNRYRGPWVCILAQTFIVILFLTITTKTTSLIVMSNFGVSIAYLLSCFAFFLNYKSKKNKFVGMLALAGCGYLLYLCFNDLLLEGFKYLIPYLIILGLGILGYKIKTLQTKKS